MATVVHPTPVLLETVDASYDCIDPAYVVVYRACLDESGVISDRVLSCIKAEVQNRFTRKIFGASHQFVEAATMIRVNGQGREDVKLLDVPDCCVFRRMPDVKTVKSIISSNRTVFRHFAPMILTEPDQHLLFEEPLLRIRSKRKQLGYGKSVLTRDSQCSERSFVGMSGVESAGSSLEGYSSEECDLQALLCSKFRNDSKTHVYYNQLHQPEDPKKSFASPLPGISPLVGNGGEGQRPETALAQNRYSVKYRLPPVSTGFQDDAEWDAFPDGDSHFTLTPDSFQRINSVQQSNSGSLLTSESPHCMPSSVSPGPTTGQDDRASSVPTGAGCDAKFTLEVDPNESIWTLKKKIQKSRGYSPRIQRLVFDGVILEDHMRIKDCKITSTSTLVLFLVMDNGELREISLT